MSKPLPLSAAFLLTTLCVAQNYTAHPIDNPASSTSQNIPFAGNSTSWDEARSQFLFPAAFLPTTGGVITGIEIVPNTSGSVPYELFELWLDHTTNTTLSTTFAANLTSPTLVFSRPMTPIAWTGATWHTLTLDTPFPYDGTRNLVLEVRKKIDRPNNPTFPTISHRVLVYPRRADLPVPIWTSGTHGSGAVDGTTATTTYSTQILMRLRFGTSPTLTIDSTRDTTGNANRSYFHIGATTTLTTRGTAGSAYAMALDFGLAPAGLSVPGLTGELWVLNPFVFLTGVLNTSGEDVVQIPIPNDPSLIGIRAIFQSLVVSGAGAQFTNVVDAPIAAY